ncbi:MAG: TRAP transporter large permease subunit [Chloroflexi bacterium]|nr:TRAP transporter large permease subunit [Chloroflexota bacterium]
MFLPIILEIARHTNRSPSRLLMPMAYGTLFGSMIPLIGAPTFLIIQDTLIAANLPPLTFFKMAPGGLLILITSIAYIVLIGRRFLPDRQPRKMLTDTDPMHEEISQDQYFLQERLALLIVNHDNPLVGKTLAESRIGQALGLTVLSIKRKHHQIVQISTDTVIEAYDQLLVLGRLDRIDELCQRPFFIVEDQRPVAEQLVTEGLVLAELLISPDSLFAHKSLKEINIRHQHQINVLGIQQGEIIRRTNLQRVIILPGDRVLIEGPQESISKFCQQPGYCQLGIEGLSKYMLDEHLLTIRVPEESSLVGKTLNESRLGSAYGITVLRVSRNRAEVNLTNSNFKIYAGDVLIVEGRHTDIEVLRGLQSLKVIPNVEADLEELTSSSTQMVEVMLSPYSKLAGKTLREAHFREKYHVTVLAVWRGDRVLRSALGDLTLQHGDALLCFGPVENLKEMGRERDFVVLKMDLQEQPLLKKAPLAAAIVVGVALLALIFDIPIAITAIMGCALMVLGGALTMENAYESIDWSLIFVLAAMLPLGYAIQDTGAAAVVSNWMVDLVGGFGPSAVLAGLMVLVIAAKFFLPAPVLTAIMAPIALNTAYALGVSPNTFMLGMAYALTASFISPLSHSVNMMVMTPGSYRFSDYIKQGLPISIIVILVSTLLLPLIFPF